jgi:hypothetical protein
MKRIAMITAVLAILMGLAACGTKPTASPVESATGAQTSLAATSTAPTGDLTPLPTDEATTEPTDSGDEYDLSNATPWPDPKSVDYSGNYLAIAKDADSSKYPALTLTNEIQTVYGTIKLPSTWSIDDPDGTPTVVDAKNRPVGQIFLALAYVSQPYYALKPEEGTLILWEAPDQFTRKMTLESDYPSASDENMKTIVRIICLMDNQPYADEDGAEYYLTYCLSFDKAYINGSSVDYVLSNAAIDAITGSFTIAVDTGE